MKGKSFTRTFSQIVEPTTRTKIVFRKLALSFVPLLALCASHVYAQQETSQPQPPQPPQPGATTQQYTREGVAVEFSVESVARGKTSEPLEGTEATVRFKITDLNAGKALGNLRPTAWIDLREKGETLDARRCREKVQSFLQPNFSERPDINLNNFFILALNHEPNISVIDPLTGFGGSKLYALAALPSPGEDWVISRDKKRLYVSLPLVNQVSVVDTSTWKVIANIATGAKPARIVLQHDERYLWVGNDGDGEAGGGGVTVIDTATLKVAAQLSTGAGHHEIALSDDDRHAFVTNKQSGTLSVIDVRRLAKVKDLKTGALPTAMAFSPLSKTVYVAHEGDGTITAVDGSKHEILIKMKAQPGLRALRFLPDGRFGFVVNRLTNEVSIFDVSTNRLSRPVPVGPAPDQITFTRDFAYVRSTGNEFITMIKIAELGTESYQAAVNRFPAGEKAPQTSPFTSLADAVVPAPGSGSVLVANPADKTIYYYTEGMAAPMGSFQNYRRDPKALLVLDNSLSETSPGVYTATVKLNRHGYYDVPFLLNSPRMVNCFGFAVKENPDLPKQTGVAIKVEPLVQDANIRAGESYQLRFKVTDPATNEPKAIKDMGVLVFLAPGVWQQRDWAKPLGDGIYEITFVPPQAGVYYVYFQSPSQKVRFNQIPFLVLQATTTDKNEKAKEARP